MALIFIPLTVWGTILGVNIREANEGPGLFSLNKPFWFGVPMFWWIYASMVAFGLPALWFLVQAQRSAKAARGGPPPADRKSRAPRAPGPVAAPDDPG